MSIPDLVYAVAGVGALLAAVLPRLVAGARPISLPVVFLALGVLLGLLPWMPVEIDPLAHREWAEHLTEVTVIVALMGAGLSLDRPPGWRSWSNTWRLLAITMPLSILAVALLGWWGLGLAPATALLLGAALAPTDPVLAGDVQVGQPGSEPVPDGDLVHAENEVKFSLTSEAGLNDALAFPFVYAAIALAAGSFSLGNLVAFHVAYKTGVGVVVGVAAGWLIGRLVFSSSRSCLRLSEHREGFVALAATFLAYGVAELASGYGFLAVFVAAVTIRSSERFHDYHQVLHEFVEQIERLLTVLVLLLLGAALADGLLEGVGWREIAVAAALLLVVRPVLGFLALPGGCGRTSERAAVAFFGVRGVGSLYYVAYALGAASFARAETVWAVVGLVVAGSVVLHGATAGVVMKRLEREEVAA